MSGRAVKGWPVEKVLGLGDIRTVAAGDARELSELVVRVLGMKAVERTLLACALNVLDQLIAAGAWASSTRWIRSSVE